MKTKWSLWIGFLLALLAGCNGYEEGPAVSFRSKFSRMQFTRPATYYTVDGVDSLPRLLNWYEDNVPYYRGVFQFTADLSEDDQWIRNGDTGPLTFNNGLGVWTGGEQVREITLSLATFPSDAICCWEVLRLSHRQLWLRSTDTAPIRELRFEE